MSRVRHAVVATAVLVASLGLVACSGSSGVHTQTSIPTKPASTSNSPSTTTPSPSWTPPNYGNAQPAVDAYLTFSALVDKAYRDPAHIPATEFDKYLQGQAKELFDANFAQEKAQGKAVRGKTIRRVRVVQNHITGAALPWAVLRDCAELDPSDPLTEYYAATGKPVPQKPHNPPGPYADTIKIFDIRGQWTITSYTIDYTKTCTP